MFSSTNCLLTCVILLLYSSKTCTGDNPPAPSLVIYIPGEPEYTDVLIRRVGDNMSLICELRGDATPRVFVWNYIPENGTMGQSRPYQLSPSLSTTSSVLSKTALGEADSGQYMCSAPPFSVTKYILVQPPGPKNCGRSTFWCGARCMAAQYVCDGYRDCERGEDEAPPVCERDVCARGDKLNCSLGRCISESACCRGGGGALCQQPSCCEEYPRYSTLDGFIEQEYPPLFDDRHAPDDYTFIQSTIYTVTACALIFMIAVVLLVSAICKMHMKRAALRSYAHAERATSHHYTMQYAQTHRFPPCYEASRLLEQERTRDLPEPPHSPHSPAGTPPQCEAEGGAGAADTAATDRGRTGLARLSSIFSSRYRQVPTQSDVELTNVRSTSLNNSPTRNRTLDDYRSPTYCDLNSEFFFTDPDTGNFARDLNIMATPIDFRPTPLDRVMDQLDRQRLTLQLGRFQLTIPRFGRRTDTDRRPDTPNVAEINIDDLDFVRMTSNETYTLNGRTIRLLGANFENYPVLPDGTRPPPYNEAMRYKFFGPPPEYLSREVLNSRADEEARTNIEMPPCYDELGNDTRNSNIPVNNDIQNTVVTSNVGNSGDIVENINGNPIITVTNTDNNLNVVSINAIMDDLPAIDSDVNANETVLVNNDITVNN